LEGKAVHIPDFLKEAGVYTLIGAPAAIARTLMKKELTVRSVIANGASCTFVAPLAGWTANAMFPAKDGHVSGLVCVVVGVATLLGKDLIAGVLREGEAFASSPRETMQAWLTFWKNLFVPGAKP
jgi:hypothetical protein